MELDLTHRQLQIVRIEKIYFEFIINFFLLLDLRLYISPSTSLLDTTNVDEAQ